MVAFSGKRPLAVCVLVFVSGACFSTTAVAPSELYRLNGYSGSAVALATADGGIVRVDRKSTVAVQAWDGQSFAAKFESVSIDPTGLMTGIIHETRAPVTIDLTQASAASVSRYSPGRTAALVVPLVVVPVITTVLTFVLLAASAGAFSPQPQSVTIRAR